MSNEIQVMEFDQSKLDLIKRTVAKGATQDEFELFLHACKRTGLDPLMKQIHAIKRWNAAEGRETMAIQTGIDGYRLVAERTGKYAGSDDPVFEMDGKALVKATVTVWKLVDGQRFPFTASARWEEYVQKKKDGSVTSFWVRMPYGQLAKCAEALALRKAFPAELSGVYTHEEMQQADSHATPLLPTIPQVRPQSKPEDGAGDALKAASMESRTTPQQTSDAPADSPVKAFCEEQADKAAADEHTAEGFIGTHTPRLAGKQAPPGRFTLDTLRGELTLQYWERPDGLGTPNHSYAKVTYRHFERVGKGGKVFTNNELLKLEWAAPPQ